MRESLPPLYYANEADELLKRNLNDAAKNYLLANADHRYADKRMFIKLMILLISWGILYVMVLTQQTIVLFSLCYFILIVIAMMLAINVVHDASHNVFFKTINANRWLNYIVTTPLGIDPDCWRIRHVIQHHAFTNVEYYDFDIDYNGFLRQTPFQAHHAHMRYQQYYWPIVAAMTFPVIIWLFDWQDRLGFKFDLQKFHRRGILGWGQFLLTKIVHLILVVIIPVLLCPQFSLWSILTIYLLSQMCCSLIFVVLLLGSHWAKATFYQAPSNHYFSHSQIRHIFNTTLNWRLKSATIEYWLGGLNLHLTHHIYPGFSHRHYQKLSNIINEIANRSNIDYHEISLKQLFIYQHKFLSSMGKKPQ